TSIGLFITFAIFLMGIAGHVALPKIHFNLNRNYNWNYVVLFGFGGVVLFYFIIGILGFWLYGNQTQIIILTNFIYWPGGIMPSLLSLFVIINIWASFGIVSSLLCEIFEYRLK